MMPNIPGPLTSTWGDIAAHESRLSAVHTRDLFEGDPNRAARFTRTTLGLSMDFSRQRIDQEALYKLYALADVMELRDRIESMFNGERINRTEDRAVLHVALRQPRGAAIGGKDIAAEVFNERDRMLNFATAVRDGRIVGSAGKPFTLIVNIGIGGSDLGPAMAVLALERYTSGAPRVEFVSNVDGCHLHDVLQDADAATTLFIISSKTFTTLETLTNAKTARAWLVEKRGESIVTQHFAAVSTNHQAMDAFGVHKDYRFQMWDWVGGRYSVWSSIGVALAIAIGKQNFEQFLAGANAMDEHFRTTEWANNLPVLMALLGVWNINFRKLPTLAVLPYDDRLKRLPAYLQQLEMESNGKSTTQDGERIAWETASVIWGEPGSNAQHSFFQLLHQGTMRAALDFIAPVNSSCGDQHHQNLALANCLAQVEALMKGQSEATVRADLARQGMPAGRIDQVAPHKVHVGDRPSTLILFSRTDPTTLGKLLALYEHKVFTQGVIWGINSFDQWGVELGKKLAESLVPLVQNPALAQDASGAVKGALARIAQWRGTLNK
jgi:glucose-6-phosphate isomerase